jgi:hypothetical protein
MRRRLGAHAAIAIAAALLCAAPAQAQFVPANRTFVSGTGSDINPCTNTQPCRSFAIAQSLTNPGGEIIALDPGGYGALTITKSLSIINNGVGEVGITVQNTSASAITVSAGASDIVTLRGLTLDGVNSSSSQGIVVNSVGTLNIQNCLIHGFGANGIVFGPTGSSALTVFDTTVSGIGGSTAAILLDPSGSNLSVGAYLSGVQVIGNAQHGIDANTQGMTGGSLQVTVVDSVVSGNPNGAGVLAPTLSAPTITVLNTKITDNNTGINAGGGAVYIAETTIAGNSTNGFFVSGSAVLNSFQNSLGTNYITDTPNVGSLTPIAQQ